MAHYRRVGRHHSLMTEGKLERMTGLEPALTIRLLLGRQALYQLSYTRKLSAERAGLEPATRYPIWGFGIPAARLTPRSADNSIAGYDSSRTLSWPSLNSRLCLHRGTPLGLAAFYDASGLRQSGAPGWIRTNDLALRRRKLLIH